MSRSWGSVWTQTCSSHSPPVYPSISSCLTLKPCTEGGEVCVLAPPPSSPGAYVASPQL